jgi:hypothetical protein
MIRSTRLSIGLRIPRVECLAVTVTGEVQFGLVLLFWEYLMSAVNFLLVESLQRFWMYYRNDFQIECPTGSGNYMSLLGVARELQHVYYPLSQLTIALGAHLHP